MPKPLTRDQLDAGLLLLERMAVHVFDADPYLSYPESFDVQMFFKYLRDAVGAERALVDFTVSLPIEGRVPYTESTPRTRDVFGWLGGLQR